MRKSLHQRKSLEESRSDSSIGLREYSAGIKAGLPLSRTCLRESSSPFLFPYHIQKSLIAASAGSAFPS